MMATPSIRSHHLVFLVVLSRPVGQIRLTPTERRVTRLVALGCDQTRIAEILRRSVGDIARVIGRVMRKTGMNRPRDVKQWARQCGISPPGDRLSVPEQLALGCRNIPKRF